MQVARRVVGEVHAKADHRMFLGRYSRFGLVSLVDQR